LSSQRNKGAKIREKMVDIKRKRFLGDPAT